MSQENIFSDGESEAVIAAAAYAIASLEEEEGSMNHARSGKGLGTSNSRTKSKTEENASKISDIGGSFKRWFTSEPKEDRNLAVSGDSFTSKPTMADQTMLEDSTAKQNNMEKAMRTTPSAKKTPTFTDKYLNDTGSKRFGSTKETRPEQKGSSTMKPTTPSFGNKYLDGKSAGISKADSEADAWEKAKMTKIRNRYEKMISTIVEWENEKKAKAKRRLEQKEKGPEQRRAKALQEYRDEISRIDKVAGDARALAEERKRNDESKTREKAKKIRSTGKIPHACCSCC